MKVGTYSYLVRSGRFITIVRWNKEKKSSVWEKMLETVKSNS